MSDTPEAKGKTTLTDRDITTTTSRRGLVRGLGIGALGLGGAALSGCVAVPVPVGYSTGYTDADNGPIIDPGGQGRGPTRAFATGITDADNGPIIDRGGYGRG